MNNEPYNLALIFTGHMIDLPMRKEPRFPANMEAVAAKRIGAAVRQALTAANGKMIGIASAARGADILFLEACAKRGIPTRIVLPKPPEEFIASSVAGVSEGNWEERFWKLWNAHTSREKVVLTGPGKAANIYDACNRRMLTLGGKLAPQFCLLAFWNGEGGDGAGGTADFIASVKSKGGKIRRVHAERLLKSHLQRNTAAG